MKKTSLLALLLATALVPGLAGATEYKVNVTNNTDHDFWVTANGDLSVPFWTSNPISTPIPKNTKNVTYTFNDSTWNGLQNWIQLDLHDSTTPTGKIRDCKLAVKGTLVADPKKQGSYLLEDIHMETGSSGTECISDLPYTATGSGTGPFTFSINKK